MMIDIFVMCIRIWKWIHSLKSTATLSNIVRLTHMSQTVFPSDVRCHRRQHSKTTERSSRRKISQTHRRRSLRLSGDWIPLCGLSEMFPSTGPEANKEGSRTVLGRMGENEKHRGNDRRQPPLSSIIHPMLPAKMITRTRWLSRMPPMRPIFF